MNKFSLKAIVIACVMVLAMDFVSGVVMMITSASHAFRPELSDEQIAEALSIAIRSQSFLIGSLILGTLSTIAGGYVAARIAKKEPYLNSGAIGVLGVLYGALFPMEDYPAWFSVIGYVSTIPAAVLGGHLAQGWIERNRIT